MNYGRRQVLVLGGGSLAALTMVGTVSANQIEVVEMRGTSRGEAVWFYPNGLAIASGTTVRFMNRDPNNSHTSTAYHPDLFNRQRRIPLGATPWDSDFLMPDQQYDVTLTVPGVYDFYCQPHEHAGMVGRIVVGRPDKDKGWEGPAPSSDDLPEVAQMSFPTVEDILANQRVFPKESP